MIYYKYFPVTKCKTPHRMVGGFVLRLNDEENFMADYQTGHGGCPDRGRAFNLLALHP